MFELELFPAREGDALILTWGDPDAPHRILIDAGREATASALGAHFEKLGLGEGAFELFIISHIDRDHIEGAQELLRNRAFAPLVKEVWFNGRGDLEWKPAPTGFERFSALHGERVSTALRAQNVAWNTAWNGGPVALSGDGLPRRTLPGGLTLTLLSPDTDQLAALAKPWDDTVAKAPSGWESFGASEPLPLQTWAEHPFKPDGSKPNGSSIAVVAEYEGRRILLAADAHVPRLLKSLKLYSEANGGSAMTLVKASHHGSRANISRELVEATACSNWVFSTSGAQFKHPDREGVARAAYYAPEPLRLYFNYDTPLTEIWRRPTEPTRALKTIFGKKGYLKIDLLRL